MEFLPGNAPYTEAYWEVLLQEGEYSQHPAPPADPESIWRGLGLEPPIEAPSPPPSGSGDGRWEEAIRFMEEGTVLTLPVVGYNRGGLLVEWNGHQGFVPVSHLADLSPYLDERKREQALRARLHQTLRLRVIEVDPERQRIILSERATYQEEQQRKALLERLRPGAICSGRVTSICSFGAFVDLGGLEGLIHISELSWSRVRHPAQVLRPGQDVQVCVLNVDQARGRVGLSLKRLHPDPWQGLGERYRVGQMVKGVITYVVDFGAFAQMEDGIEGFIHLSELAEGQFLHPRNVVREGMVVRLRVIHVDEGQRRLGLSLRQAAESPAA
ncbi:MAG: S1 RNA-binding domain-containing protein [Anaerolineae bacterium]|nr:S1 RNA-binding domain-containing protein [Anaerolineae bacterium]